MSNFLLVSCKQTAAPWRFFLSMRKRSIQSINLKLSDLKEYDAVKQERAALRAQSQDKMPEKSTAEPSLARVGPKTKKEIMERILFKTE